LDRFLIKYFKDNNINYSDWLIQGQENALDYKVRIYPPDKRSIEYYLPLARKLNSNNYPNREYNLSNAIDFSFKYLYPTPYFANEDKIKWNRDNIDNSKSKLKDLRFAVFSNEPINIQILSFNNKSLLDTIENHLVEFFLTHNFGNRQNKGFGSFTVIKINGETIKNNDISSHFDYTKKISDANSLNDVFFKIDKVYKKIKNDPMLKASLIRDYFNKKNIIWEKNAIKIKLIKNETLNQSNRYAFVRALLGLAILHDYRQLGKRVWITHNKGGDQQIERFQSPIFFKVINKTIYLCASKKNLLNKIEGESFWFYLNDKHLTDIKEINKKKDKFKLNVPNEFDLIGFLNKITEKI
jgi:hypothetical protein